MVKILLTLLLMISVATGQSGLKQTQATGSFRIKYEKRISSRELKRIGDVLDSTAAAISQRLNIPLNRKFDVQLYPSQEQFKKELRPVLFDDGLFKGNKLYLIAFRGFKDETKAYDAISRVVARAVLSQTRFCPLWLLEAYSLYAGDALERFNLPSRSNLLSFHDLSEDFARADLKRDQQEIYAKLAATMGFLVNRYGEHKVESLFVQFQDGAPLEQVFESTFGEKISVIEQEWVKAVTPQSK